MTLIICINLKFTGLVYSGFFCLLFFVFWCIRAYKENKFKEKFKQYISYYLIIGIISILVVGISPYIKNIKNKGNPFYPLMGEGKEDIISYNQPKCFEEKGQIEKFFISLFGVSENIQSNSSDKEPTVKIPFTFTEDEIKIYNRPDLRISGFGVEFSGIFCISILAAIVVLYRLYKNKNKELFAMFLAYIGVSMLLALITEGSWWARYIPYIYGLPIIVASLLAMEKSRLLKTVCGIILLLLVFNNSLIMYTTVNNYYTKYSVINTEMKNMKKISNKKGSVKVALRTKAFCSILYNFKDKNINVELEDSNEKLKDKKYVNYFHYSKE